MRKLTMLADIPQQCYECVLVGIKPVSQYLKLFLAHLWCAYAMALCLSWIVCREVGCVCVEHNYPKMWMD